jgi:precorrin-6A synthase
LHEARDSSPRRFEDEVLVAGKLSEVMGDIESIRERARQKNGWIMDTYLLRKSED